MRLIHRGGIVLVARVVTLASPGGCIVFRLPIGGENGVGVEQGQKLIECWTVQESKFLEQSGKTIYCTAEFADPTFINAYRWMKEAYRKLKGHPMSQYPVWFWVKSRDDSEEERYEMVAALLAEVQYTTPKVLLDLKIPSTELLLSLYSKWNELLDYTRNFRREPRRFRDLRGLFDTSKCEAWDHVQCVAPFVERDWIESIAELDIEKVKRVLQ